MRAASRAPCAAASGARAWAGAATTHRRTLHAAIPTPTPPPRPPPAGRARRPPRAQVKVLEAQLMRNNILLKRTALGLGPTAEEDYRKVESKNREFGKMCAPRPPAGRRVRSRPFCRVAL